jgi:hypothetical protein
MNTFTLGQDVTHPLHGTGTVTNIDEPRKLVRVFIPARMGYVEVHPISLTPVETSDSL